ncbi:TIGR02147 family protein [Bdellovibrionota bacterium FG-2]
MNTVLEYGDYRTYLKDRFESEKKRRKHWSYGVWAKELGLQSSSTLIMILNGDRNPGPKLIQQLARYLKLNNTESAHFERTFRT